VYQPIKLLLNPAPIRSSGAREARPKAKQGGETTYVREAKGEKKAKNWGEVRETQKSSKTPPFKAEREAPTVVRGGGGSSRGEKRKSVQKDLSHARGRRGVTAGSWEGEIQHEGKHRRCALVKKKPSWQGFYSV